MALSQHSMVEYPLIELKGSDTVILFKLEQGRKLALINEQKKKYEKLYWLQIKELDQKDSIISYQNEVIKNYRQIEQSQIVIINEKQSQVEMVNDESKILKNEIKKQKRYKWTAIISGIALNTLTIWIIMTH
jgi:thymidylate kinase